MKANRPPARDAGSRRPLHGIGGRGHWLGPSCAIVALGLATCGPPARPTREAVARPSPVSSVPERGPTESERAPPPNSLPVTSWRTSETARCRGFATASGEAPLTGEPRGALSLKTHRVRAIVSGGLSRTEVVEELVNDDARAIEARFTFPLPD